MHTAVAALGVAAIAYQFEMDFDLRSRCLLLPTHPPAVGAIAPRRLRRRGRGCGPCFSSATSRRGSGACAHGRNRMGGR